MNNKYSSVTICDQQKVPWHLSNRHLWTMETQEQDVRSRLQMHYNEAIKHCSSVFIANFKQTSHIVLVFLFLTLNR